jgi:hypothetical protein
MIDFLVALFIRIMWMLDNVVLLLKSHSGKTTIV